MLSLSITVLIIIVTVLISLAAWNKPEVMEKLIFYPPAVSENNQYYRFFSSGFLHADMMHLLFNMFSFFIFGQSIVEPEFINYFGAYGKTAYLLMYVLALPVSLLPTYFKHRHNYNYRSLGASGAVSAVIFAGIIISPLSRIGFFIIPPIIPGFIFGPLYLLLSWYLDRRGGDNINHSAHIWGALFGVIYMIVATKLFGTVNVLSDFIEQVSGYFRSF